MVIFQQRLKLPCQMEVKVQWISFVLHRLFPYHFEDEMLTLGLFCTFSCSVFYFIYLSFS